MSARRVSFGVFSIGDHTSFSQSFSREDYEAFAQLSGDRNPLHHDATYAEGTEFSQPIVPLHLLLAPLSRIAGMIFPGTPSLYLGHEVKSVAPVMYGDPLTYSARITAVNSSHRVLTLSVLACRSKEVVLAATMRVQARETEWQENSEIDRRSVTGRPVTLITGASGAIGSALARRLANEGHDLLLHGRTDTTALDRLTRVCMDSGATVKTFMGSLQTESDSQRLARWCLSQQRWDNVVHAASPSLDSELSELVNVNYTALRVIADQFLLCCLQRQSGILAFVSSSAVDSHPPGWDDYVAAKSMAASYVLGIDQKYSQFGIHGRVVAPGYVRTKFSEGLFGEAVPAMLPEEAAERIWSSVFAESSAPYHVIDVHGARPGRYGFQSLNGQQRADPERQPTMNSRNDDRGGLPDAVSDRDDLTNLDHIVRSFLGLSASEDLEQAEMGTTPGWDSLRHIEMLLLIEHKFGVHFSSRDIAKTQRFAGIRELLSNGAKRS